MKKKMADFYTLVFVEIMDIIKIKQFIDVKYICEEPKSHINFCH